ncbi:hypothetical protein CBS101457_000818 [Exobasidium rhododendri]|nr:hypothetical protein CBS101457_000818 [Exobasidium rhododendri]
MPNLPLGEDLKTLFDEITSGKQSAASVRAILVQNDNGTLRLVESLPEESTDKEDFSNVLGRLFAKEPSKSGYALYRLDSRSPAGLCEWINCAYRPEGARVREKMQYTLTQASLFAGLSEQHFLDTVYGGTSSEFTFPSRLRNQRKHDYQNPQSATSGKKPAEAAGTGTAGKRNFDIIPSPGQLPRRSSTSDKQPSSSDVLESKPASESTRNTPESNAVQEIKPSPASEIAATSTPASLPRTDEAKSAEATNGIDESAREANVGEKEGDTAVRATSDVVKEDDSSTKEGMSVAAEQKEKDSETVEAAGSAGQDRAPLSSIDVNSTDTEEVPRREENGENKEKAKEEIEEDDVMNQSIAPSSDERLTREAVEEAESAPVLQHETNSIEAVAPHEATTATDDDESRATDASSTSVNTMTELSNKPSTSSVGMGTGVQGLETEKERHLAASKTEELKLKSGGVHQGGSSLGFPWQTDVEPALHGLAKQLGGTAEWNLVILKIDLSREEIELASEPRFILPGDMSEALPTTEPCYAFYSHPAIQTESDDQAQIAVIYICPLHSSIRQRMLYSANLAITSTRVGTIPGLNVFKRIETSDPTELTSSFFSQELLNTSSTENSQAKAFSKPRRPGRK